MPCGSMPLPPVAASASVFATKRSDSTRTSETGAAFLERVDPGRGLPIRPAGLRTPQPVASSRSQLPEGSPGPRGRRRSSASLPHPNRRAPTPGPPHWDRERPANPWTRAAFASQGLWLRRHATSGRNLRPSTCQEQLSSFLGSAVAPCDIARAAPSSRLYAGTTTRSMCSSSRWCAKARQLPSGPAFGNVTRR
jgi:hypothetical protein